VNELPRKAPDAAQLLGPFVRRGVDFVVVGGVAGLAQGSNFPTFDLDLAYSRDRSNVERLVTALTEIGVKLRGAPEELPFQLDVGTIENGANFTFITEHGDLDVLGDIAGIPSFEQLRDAAKLRIVGGFEVRVASIDHLIAMKRAANRTKDKLMLEEYIVLADELERQGQSS
jgi:hypothetical protein